MTVMSNKFIRFFIFESQSRMIFLGLVVGVAITGMQLKVLGNQQLQIKKVTAEKQLVGRILDMEKIVRANTIKTATKTQLSKIDFVFRGTILKNGISYALIDDMVFAQGDSIGEYAVIKITQGETVIENRSTKEIKKLYFRE